jgi:type IV pilus biogenesis protein CpaD/CtpE
MQQGRNIVKTRTALAILAVSFAVTLSKESSSAEPIPAELVNVWTGAGERAALKVLADDYDAAGGKFVNVPVPGSDSVMSMTVNRIKIHNRETGLGPPRRESIRFQVKAAVMLKTS